MIHIYFKRNITHFLVIIHVYKVPRLWFYNLVKKIIRTPLLVYMKSLMLPYYDIFDDRKRKEVPRSVDHEAPESKAREIGHNGAIQKILFICFILRRYIKAFFEITGTQDW